LKVELSANFKNSIYPKLSEADKKALHAFISHVQKNGIENLPGKLKPSWNIPSSDDDYENKVSFTRTFNIWHYHIGRPEYEKSLHGNYLTSDEVIFIKRFDPKPNKIRVVGWSSHPLELPTEEDLKTIFQLST